MRIWILLGWCLLITCLPATAQVKFTTVINDREVSKDDYLQVQYVVENASSVESLTPPVFTGFSVASGPMEQTGINIINGAVSRSEVVTYVLKPTAPGKYLIGGASAVVDGKPLRSNTISVTVTNAPGKKQGGSANPLFGLSMPEEMPEEDEEYLLTKDESALEKIKGNLFVKLDVNKTTCYVGEPVVATYKLYSRLRSESKVTKRPSLSQFSVYDMVQPEANNPSTERLNGKLYNVHIIRKVQLYALQDGSFELDPVEVDNTVSFLRLENSRTNKPSMHQLLDEYINGMTDGKLEEQQIVLSSKPVTINVKPLPTVGRPASFDGAVGKFSVSAMVPKADIAATETSVLQVALKGQGNLTLINAPAVQWPQGVEAFEPTVKENLDKTIAPITGTKLFEYSFTCKHAGKIVIPPIDFSYFDPSANAYKTIRTDSIVTEISEAAVKKHHTTAARAVNEQSATNTGFRWLRLLWLLPLFAIAVLVIIVNRKKSAVQKPAGTGAVQVASHETPANATDPLEGARLALAAVNSQLFYKETGRATWHLLSEKFGLNASQLNKPEAIRVLQQRNVPPETIQLLQYVLHDCEIALYTPVHTENDMRITLDRAEKFRDALTLV